MSLAEIFKPIRRPTAIPVDVEVNPSTARVQITETGASWQSRVGIQPVTNTSPSGAPVPTTQEEGWLALLELVFAETGWPDAE